jgi:hypothetical protein
MITKEEFEKLKAGVETIIAGERWVRDYPQGKQTTVDDWLK